MPELDLERNLPWGDKKALYGKKNLIAVGGKTKGAGLGDVVERKTDATVAPVTHHGMPTARCRDHAFLLQGRRGHDASGR